MRSLVLSLLLAVIAHAQDDIPSERRELNELLENTKHYEDEIAALRSLPPDKKKAFIDLIRREMSEESRRFGGAGEGSLPTLYFLGDTAARDQLVKNFYRDGDMGRPTEHYHTFRAAGDPELIPMLAPALLRPESYQRFGTDAFTYPLSFHAAHTMIAIVANSSAFNSDVINWARRFGEATPLDELRGIMREWWHANEALFREMNYKAIQPGRELKAEPQPDLPMEARAAPDASPAPRISAPATVASAPAASAAEPSAPSTALLVTVAAAATALLAGLLFFWKRRA